MDVNLARKPQSARTTNPRAGFTLPELLVVLAILLLLAAPLAAAVSKAQHSARRIHCSSNLHQWGIATHTHATDHEDRLPPDGAPNGISIDSAWYIDLPIAMGIATYPHAGTWRTNPAATVPNSVWLCPANRRRSNGNLLFHYTLNRRVNGSGDGTHPTSSASIPAPSETIWLFDNGRLAAVAAEGNVHTNLHGTGAHFLFLDGHAQRFPASAYWDFRRNRARTNAPSLRWFP